MEKYIRAVIVGFFLSCSALIGLGWRAYAKIDNIRAEVKSEIKKEMVEIRNRDMEHIQNRFNTLETLIAGKVISKQVNYEAEK
jgi:hypothetical protein